MLLFVGVRTVQISNVPDPLHTVVFAVLPYYGYPQPFDIRVRDDGRLAVTFEAEKDNTLEHDGGPPQITIYVFDPVAKKTTSHVLSTPRNPVAGRTYTIALPDELSRLKLNDIAISHDGYLFQQEYRNGGNLMTEIFGFDEYGRFEFHLSKDGRRVPIPGISDEYGQHEFIGWVETE